MTSMLKYARGLSVLAPLMLAACGGRAPEAPAPRGDLVGVWDLVSVNGGALPTPSPEERTVLLESIALTLTPEGSYSLASSFRVAGQDDSQHMTVGGVWRATEDVLRFETDGGPAIVEFGYARAGNDLRMVDEQLHEWVMRRRQ